jgi:hypothetical protein
VKDKSSLSLLCLCLRRGLRPLSLPLLFTFLPSFLLFPSKELSKTIYDAAATRTLLIGTKGLEIMNDDPSSVDVLYLKIQDNEGRVAKVVNLILETFHNAGLVSRSEFEKGVKLHATVFNTRYRNQPQTQVCFPSSLYLHPYLISIY